MFTPIKSIKSPFLQKSIQRKNEIKVNKKQTISEIIDEFLKEKDQFSNVKVTIDRSDVIVEFWFEDSMEPWIWEEFMPNSKMQKAAKELTEKIKKVIS